jgi:hypothetical protein
MRGANAHNYSQPGASANTNPITAASNAVLLIVSGPVIVGSTEVGAIVWGPAPTA